jgi:NAD(P)-dependent dehydrogenase (short-subunit alcohol dehydrogenase family)
MKIPKDARVVLTGGGSGLGRALALELASEYKARILLADINVERANETAELVRARGGKAEVIACDVGKLEDVQAVEREITRLWGGTDVLVNNAGVACIGPVGDVAIPDWEWIMRINLWGVIYGCHVFLPKMKERKSGFVLNIASSAAIASLPEMGPYNVTKAAVLSLSETLYSELANYNINVSALCPTFFQTNLLETFRSTENRQRDAAHMAFDKALMTAEQIAHAAIDGLERNKLVVIPQIDGKAVWGIKRLSYGTFFNLLRKVETSGLKERFIARR